MSTERIESYPPPELLKKRNAPPQRTNFSNQGFARGQEGRAESPESPTFISSPEIRTLGLSTPDADNDKISSTDTLPPKDISCKKALPRTPLQPKPTALPTPESKSTRKFDKPRNAMSSGTCIKASNGWPISWPPTADTPADPRAPAAAVSTCRSHDDPDNALQDLAEQQDDSNSPDERTTAYPKDATPTRPARAPNTTKAVAPPAKPIPSTSSTSPSPSRSTPLNEIALIWQTIATQTTNTHRYRRFSECGRVAGEYLDCARAAQRLFAEFKGECDAHERRVVGMMGMGVREE